MRHRVTRRECCGRSRGVASVAKATQPQQGEFDWCRLIIGASAMSRCIDLSMLHYWWRAEGRQQVEQEK
jgi:hypothetical protein